MAYYILKSYKLKIDPLRIFEVFSKQKHSFFLDSSLNSKYLGRYSFLGIEPFLIFKMTRKDPFKEIRGLMSRYGGIISKSSFPFLGGAVGYFSYDLGFTLEKKIKKSLRPNLGLPDCFFGFYNAAVVIDHIKRLLYICSVGFPENNLRLARLLAERNFKNIYNLLSGLNESRNTIKVKQHKKKDSIRLDSNFTKEAYLAAVKKAKSYIKRGDIYQVNLSQRFEAKTNLSSQEIYKRLRQISPSYFSAYFDAQEFQILSSSPERFLKLENDTVITRPMKGTRPRGSNRIQDRRLKRELLNSAKDTAELTMIVDLERNDLGRACHYNSIRVKTLKKLERYRTVFQTTASIYGKLHRDKDRFDLLRACFPGGSVTGCPKIRAMEIINELEPNQRSIYTGSLGYLSFSGGMDFNILIRTILKIRNKLYFGTGGGIVADSDPEAEYQETLVKAKAMMEAIRGINHQDGPCKEG